MDCPDIRFRCSVFLILRKELCDIQYILLLDIRIMHPNAPSYVNKPIERVYELHESEKKRTYNERVLQIEKGSFTPIVGSTFGGMGKEAQRHHKRIASLIAAKKNEEYADVMNYVRTRLRFSVLKSILTAIRGVRGKCRLPAPISSLSFNLLEQWGTVKIPLRVMIKTFMLHLFVCVGPYERMVFMCGAWIWWKSVYECGGRCLNIYCLMCYRSA